MNTSGIILQKTENPTTDTVVVYLPSFDFKKCSVKQNPKLPA